MKFRIITYLAALSACIATATAQTETSSEQKVQELVKLKQNPVSGLRQVGVDITLSPSVPATGGTEGSYSTQIVWPFSLGEDWRLMYSYNYTGVTPAMAIEMVGIGSQYVMATTDSKGGPLEGSKTYKIQLPPNIPAKDFWSFVVYDNQSRSELQTDQQFPSIGSKNKDIVTNADGSVDVWFGPTAPKGHKNNWVQTVPSRGWSALLRLYGPEKSWFDKTWKPGEFERITENGFIEGLEKK